MMDSPRPITIPSQMDKNHEWHEENRRALTQHHKRLFIDMIGGIKAFEDFTLDKFRPQEAPVAYEAAVRFDPTVDNLFFYGKNRVGKTHLITAIVHKFFDLKKRVAFFTMPELINECRILESKCDFEGKKDFLNRIIQSEVLAIDEWAIGNVTEYAIDVLWQILEGRIKDRRNGFIGTSNWPLRDLQPRYGQDRRERSDLMFKYGGKIPTRLEELCGPKNIILFPQKVRS